MSIFEERIGFLHEAGESVELRFRKALLAHGSDQDRVDLVGEREEASDGPGGLGLFAEVIEPGLEEKIEKRFPFPVGR